MTFAPQFSLSNNLPESIVLPEEESQFRIKLKEILQSYAEIINKKSSIEFEEVEILNGETFPGATPQVKNNIFRKILNTGGLPNATTKVIPHGITNINNNWFFVHIYGTAEELAGAGNRPYYIPLPNSGPTYQVELMIDNTNINITTITDLSAFTKSYMILEFYKG